MARELRITVLSGVSAGDVFRYELAEGQALRIGRSSECDLVLGEPSVSRDHAAIELRREGFFIVDRESTHGTVHMGFRLDPGASGAKRLGDGDEFKIGDALFRVQLDEPGEDEAEAEGGSGASDRTPFGRAKAFFKTKLGMAAGGLGALLLLMLLLPTESSGPGLPRQYSSIPRNIPSYRLTGYWPGSSKTSSRNKDGGHLDKAQYILPNANVLIEYHYMSQAPVSVSVGGVLIGELEPHPDGWQHRQIISRDVIEGEERRLVFDNLSWPPEPGKPRPRKILRWAVHNVRSVPLPRGYEPSADAALRSALGLSIDADKTPSGPFLLVRALQQVVLELLVETGRDAVEYGISLEVPTVEPIDGDRTHELLDAMLRERDTGASPEATARHIRVLTEEIQRIEGELWRRTNSRLAEAQYAADVKNWILAYDNLMGVQAMFPGEDDYRWVKANKLLENPKIVPAKVRKDPNRYRR